MSEKTANIVGTVLAAIIVAVGSVLAVWRPWESARPREPAGHIAHPRTGQHVARAFTVDATLAGIPGDSHVWFAVQVGNLLFPKEPEVPRGDRHPVREIVEGGSPPGGRFALVLLMVDADGERAIEAWLGRGRSGQGLQGLASIPGSVRLDVVPDVVLGAP